MYMMYAYKLTKHWEVCENADYKFHSMGDVYVSKFAIDDNPHSKMSLGVRIASGGKVVHASKCIHANTWKAFEKVIDSKCYKVYIGSNTDFIELQITSPLGNGFSTEGFHF